MQTYYSIISIAINHTLQERIGIGMLLVDAERRYFRFAEDKLTLLKGLLSADKIAFAKTYLRSLQTEIAGLDTDTGADWSPTHRWSSKSYVEYLNKYANNLVLFSEPKTLDMVVTPEVFERLFSKWIFEITDHRPDVIKLSIHDEVKERLYPKIDHQVNLDVVLTQDAFSELFLPVEVNFIGKNGSQVIGQAVDFNKRNYDLEYDLTRYGTLIKAVESTEEQEGTYFVMGMEPDKHYAKQHRLWNQVRESNMFRFVDMKELSLIEQFVEENGVEPYFEKHDG